MTSKNEPNHLEGAGSTDNPSSNAIPKVSSLTPSGKADLAKGRRASALSNHPQPETLLSRLSRRNSLLNSSSSNVMPMPVVLEDAASKRKSGRFSPNHFVRRASVNFSLSKDKDEVAALEQLKAAAQRRSSMVPVSETKVIEATPPPPIKEVSSSSDESSSSDSDESVGSKLSIGVKLKQERKKRKEANNIIMKLLRQVSEYKKVIEHEKAELETVYFNKRRQWLTEAADYQNEIRTLGEENEQLKEKMDAMEDENSKRGKETINDLQTLIKELAMIEESNEIMAKQLESKDDTIRKLREQIEQNKQKIEELQGDKDRIPTPRDRSPTATTDETLSLRDDLEKEKQKTRQVSLLVSQLHLLLNDQVSDTNDHHKRLLNDIYQEKESHRSTLQLLEEERKKRDLDRQRIRELVQSQATTLHSLEQERQRRDVLTRHHYEQKNTGIHAGGEEFIKPVFRMHKRRALSEDDTALSLSLKRYSDFMMDDEVKAKEYEEDFKLLSQQIASDVIEERDSPEPTVSEMRNPRLWRSGTNPAIYIPALHRSEGDIFNRTVSESRPREPQMDLSPREVIKANMDRIVQQAGITKAAEKKEKQEKKEKKEKKRQQKQEKEKKKREAELIKREREMEARRLKDIRKTRSTEDDSLSYTSGSSGGNSREVSRKNSLLRIFKRVPSHNDVESEPTSPSTSRPPSRLGKHLSLPQTSSQIVEQVREALSADSLEEVPEEIRNTVQETTEDEPNLLSLNEAVQLKRNFGGTASAGGTLRKKRTSSFFTTTRSKSGGIH
ncbi:hypothetical protein PROFUN_01199 [Planoprotostelium fungivorum]|uniref:Uncharacterized protein n=1 Tax=Planoprotostelium fungivorum TaxID=1890364 RepID=A0A2P6NCN3_9EUKA|nr:hypothetical protein PROFUN_01199 [Planoprotostelium fungivorum]